MKKQLLRKKCYMAMLALAGAVMFAAMPVAATPLELTKSYPDITSQDVYAVADGFVGSASLFSDAEDSSSNITGGSFNLDSFIGGDFTISGSFSYGGTDYSGALLTGKVTAAGDDGYGLYEYLFTVDGGTAASLFGGIGVTGGTIIDTWSQVADTFPAAPVPEPATLSLMLIGGSALVALRRRRSPFVV